MQSAIGATTNTNIFYNFHRVALLQMIACTSFPNDNTILDAFWILTAPPQI